MGGSGSKSQKGYGPNAGVDELPEPFIFCSGQVLTASVLLSHHQELSIKSRPPRIVHSGVIHWNSSIESNPNRHDLVIEMTVSGLEGCRNSLQTAEAIEQFSNKRNEVLVVLRAPMHWWQAAPAAD